MNIDAPRWLKYSKGRRINTEPLHLHFLTPTLFIVSVVLMALGQLTAIAMLVTVLTIAGGTYIVHLFYWVKLYEAGIAWFRLGSLECVKWEDLTQIDEYQAVSPFPAIEFQDGVLRLPTVNREMLQARRASIASLWQSASLPMLPLKEVVIDRSNPLELFAGFLLIISPGLTSLPGMQWIFIALSGAFLADSLFRRPELFKLTEDGIDYTYGRSRRSIAYTDIRRAEISRVGGRILSLHLESVTGLIAIPFEMPNFDQWKDAIAARLPEGVVIKDE